MPNVFSVPIFFIVFRETLEAVIVISVLLGIVEQITNNRLGGESPTTIETEKDKQDTEVGVHPGGSPPIPSHVDDASNDDVRRKKLLRKLRIQVCQDLPCEFSDQTSPRRRP